MAMLNDATVNHIDSRFNLNYHKELSMDGFDYDFTHQKSLKHENLGGKNRSHNRSFFFVIVQRPLAPYIQRNKNIQIKS